MSPSPEPVAPSPEIQKALESLTEVAGPWIEGIVGHEVILPILARLYLAAKIEGKEEDARLMCWACAGDGWTTATQGWDHRDRLVWQHFAKPGTEKPPLMTFQPCIAAKIQDTLLKLREEAK